LLKILVTGVAGFIGYHVAASLLARGAQVTGIDNINDYYDTSLKKARLQQLETLPEAGNFRFSKLDISHDDEMAIFFETVEVDSIVHLAAQAGVRYSMENPHAYIDANIRGFMNILTGAQRSEVNHLVYASSSSVYGNSKTVPFSTEDQVDRPVSMYAATKKSNELMAHVYSHLYQLPTTGLRFFTVYGPWGRPDMSPFLFANAIFNETPIKLFNHGKHQRDFTYIDDIVEGVVNVLDSPPVAGSESVPYKIYNIGNNAPIELLDYVATLERHIGKKAVTKLAPLQPGDVVTTYADVDALGQEIGYRPSTTIEQRMAKFIEWYRDYYNYK
jgi:UDP-glucuronate 4-epimerase